MGHIVVCESMKSKEFLKNHFAVFCQRFGQYVYCTALLFIHTCTHSVLSLIFYTLLHAAGFMFSLIH